MLASCSWCWLWGRGSDASRGRRVGLDGPLLRASASGSRARPRFAWLPADNSPVADTARSVCTSWAAARRRGLARPVRLRGRVASLVAAGAAPCCRLALLTPEARVAAGSLRSAACRSTWAACGVHQPLLPDLREPVKGARYRSHPACCRRHGRTNQGAGAHYRWGSRCPWHLHGGTCRPLTEPLRPEVRRVIRCRGTCALSGRASRGLYGT